MLSINFKMGACCTTIEYSNVGILEKWGDYHETIDPGCHCLNCWCGVRVRDYVSLRVQQLEERCDTKTSDNVTVSLLVAIQYQVKKNQAHTAFYSLDDPKKQIKTYVDNSVRSSVPNMTLDQVYSNKDQIANDVKEQLESTMEKYGFEIISTLITSVDPDKKVVAAMNEINAAQRMREAAEDKAEAQKIIAIKAAEADAESKKLSGEGIANQRRAIVDGLRESVMEFSEAVPGSSPQDVMQLVMMTQYFDTMKDIGADSRAKTIFIPHSPGGLTDISNQIRNGIMQGQETSVVASQPRVPPKMKMEM